MSNHDCYPPHASVPLYLSMPLHVTPRFGDGKASTSPLTQCLTDAVGGFMPALRAVAETAGGLPSLPPGWKPLPSGKTPRVEAWALHSRTCQASGKVSCRLSPRDGATPLMVTSSNVTALGLSSGAGTAGTHASIHPTAGGRVRAGVGAELGGRHRRKTPGLRGGPRSRTGPPPGRAFGAAPDSSDRPSIPCLVSFWG